MAELRGYINRVMQVITGKFRGRKLKSVPTTQTRPTLGRVKESIFDMINEYIPNSVVLDLFAGSGTTIIACEQNKRIGYVMELDPKYVDVIIDRWETLTGEKAELISE